MSEKNIPKVILITGTSSGFGLLTAARLSAKHKVIATLRSLDKSGSLLSEVNHRQGVIDLLELDVTQKRSIESAVQYVAGKYGYLDVLVNNAGYGIGGYFEDLTEDEIRAQMETNFFGVQNMIRETLPLMRPRKQGKIINISSIAGLTASPCFGAYTASKWALEGFSESLYYELMPFGIHVALIEPGTYKTKIFQENAKYAKNFADPQSPYYYYSQHLKKKVMNFVNGCRKDPEMVARLVEKLIDDPYPHFRNIPDWESRIRLFLRKVLPFELHSYLTERLLFGDLKKKN